LKTSILKIAIKILGNDLVQITRADHPLVRRYMTPYTGYDQPACPDICSPPVYLGFADADFWCTPECSLHGRGLLVTVEVKTASEISNLADYLPLWVVIDKEVCGFEVTMSDVDVMERRNTNGYIYREIQFLFVRRPFTSLPANVEKSTNVLMVTQKG
jgi:hypothetical protein